MKKQNLLIVFIMMYATMAFSQIDTTSKGDFTGVAVSPASMHVAVKPGTSQVKELKITNDTKSVQKFQIGYSDFMMGRTGKPTGVKSEDSKYALSRWISISPSYVEVKPGEIQKVAITITIPNDASGSIAAWTVITVDQVKDRTPLSSEKKGEELVNIGVVPSFGFGVYIYQNPPNVRANDLEIEKITYRDTLGTKKVTMVVKNIGDGIGSCSSYLELTSLSTGKKEKLGVRRFSILPQFYRDFVYDLPANLQKGKYSALGVIDYGNEDEIKVAELDFSIE